MNSNVSGGKKANAVIVGAGIVAVIGIACVTSLTINAAISKFNGDADRAYAAAVESSRTQQLVDWLEQHDPSSSSQNINIPEISSDDINDSVIRPTDVIEIDGKFYINSELIEGPDGSHSINCPCYHCRYGDQIDDNDVVMVDETKYVYITNTKSDSTGVVSSDTSDTDNNSGNNADITKPGSDDNVGTNFFDGIDYISIDIDGNAIYLIEKGDTLSQISGKLGYSVSELAEYNNIKNVDLIYAGSSLRIPVTKEFYDYIKTHNAIKS